MPSKLLLSSCLLGVNCNYKGGNNLLQNLNKLKKFCQENNIEVVHFCPEDTVFGTPRAAMNIHLGDGNDVLAGRGKVLTHAGSDVTDGMKQAAQNTLDFCISHQVTHALLMEGSPACGSQWVYDGSQWPNKSKIPGQGVAAALLAKHNISIYSMEHVDALIADLIGKVG